MFKNKCFKNKKIMVITNLKLCDNILFTFLKNSSSQPGQTLL